MANIHNVAPDFIGTDNLQHVAEEVSKNVFLGPGYTNAAELEALGVEVLTGIQYKRTDHILVRKGGTTRRKTVGDNVNNKIGYLEERTLVAKLSWNRFVDNIDNYCETVFGVDAEASYPFATQSAEAILKTYAEDLAANLWFGDMEDGEAGFDLYDGFHTLIAKEVTNGGISAAKKNLIALSATMAAPTDTDDDTPYALFMEWYMKLDPRLRAQEFVVAMDHEHATWIAQGYANRYHGNFKVDYVAGGSYSIPELPNATIVPVLGMGTGTQFIATVKGNLQYGCDTESNQTFVATKVGSDNDLRDVIFQIQSIQGARIKNVQSYAFCCTGGTQVNSANLQGDYKMSTLIITANGGSVKVNGVAYQEGKEYLEGSTVTLVATANEGKTFSQWSDGVTTATRSVVLKGNYPSYTAVFA